MTCACSYFEIFDVSFDQNEYTEWMQSFSRFAMVEWKPSLILAWDCLMWLSIRSISYVLFSVPFWAAARKETFVLLSVCPFIGPSPPSGLSALKSAILGLIYAVSGLKSALSDLNYTLSDRLRPKICIRPEIYPPGPEICHLFPEISPLRLKIYSRRQKSALPGLQSVL